jgi:hypothetical protein
VPPEPPLALEPLEPPALLLPPDPAPPVPPPFEDDEHATSAKARLVASKARGARENGVGCGADLLWSIRTVRDLFENMDTSDAQIKRGCLYRVYGPTVY